MVFSQPPIQGLQHGCVHSQGIFPGFWEPEVSLPREVKDLCLQEGGS